MRPAHNSAPESDSPAEDESPRPRITLVSPPVDGLSINLDVPFVEQKQALINTFERRYVQAMLDATDNNISASARRAKVDRKSFWKLLRRLGIDVRDRPSTRR